MSMPMPLSATSTWHMPSASVTVTDNGRGIPVDLHPKHKKPALELILTTLHSGAKFGEGDNYIHSGGLHGVGSSVVNALSRKLIATIRRDGGEWRQEFRQGKTASELVKLGPSRQHGTTIQCEPDPAIFPKTSLDTKTIRAHLEDMSYIHAGLRIHYKDEDAGTEEDLSHPGGIPEFLTRLVAESGKPRACDQPFTFSRDGGERLEAALIWTEATDEVQAAMKANFPADNTINRMVSSGARGNWLQIRNIAGMRGLVNNPKGEIIPRPIISSYREGLSVAEYFIATHGARKGLADTALKTADAGYLTRRLCDVAQDVVITEEDCGTIMGLEIGALKEGEDIIEPLSERIVGNVAGEDVEDPQLLDESGRRTLLVESGQMIDEDTARAIEESGIETIKIRSVLTCEAKRGLCRMCYGRNLATMQMVDLGEAVGIISAQSIGEPGTQLTMRTFHIGGAAQVAAQSKIEASHDGKIKPSIAFMLLPRDKAKFDKFVDLTDEASPLQTMGGCSEPVTMRVFGSERQQHDAKRDAV